MRTKKNGTIDDLAEKLRIDRTYCGRLLSGQRTPGLELRRKLRDAFGIPIEDWDEPASHTKNPRERRHSSAA